MIVDENQTRNNSGRSRKIDDPNAFHVYFTKSRVFYNPPQFLCPSHPLLHFLWGPLLQSLLEVHGSPGQPPAEHLAGSSQHSPRRLLEQVPAGQNVPQRTWEQGTPLLFVQTAAGLPPPPRWASARRAAASTARQTTMTFTMVTFLKSITFGGD